MWQVRPLDSAHLTAVESLLKGITLRLSTLPADSGKLAESIAASCAGLAGDDPLATLLFGLFDDQQLLHGIAGIQPHAGGDEPFYSYRIDELVHASRRLGIHQRQAVLYLSHELTGLTSLCSFALGDELRATPLFHLLSRARLLYIARHRHAFADELICEIQGIWDDQGQSLFWRSVGELFFGMDFITADQQCALHGKTVIAELLPAYPVYNTLLPDAVQDVIARPHPATVRTTEWLRSEGMYKTRFVDPFDAGPTYRGKLELLASMKAIRVFEAINDTLAATAPEGVSVGAWLLASGEGRDFCCVLVKGYLYEGIMHCEQPAPLARNVPGLALPLEVAP